jgi:hypothetical protein
MFVHYIATFLLLASSSLGASGMIHYHQFQKLILPISSNSKSVKVKVTRHSDSESPSTQAEPSSRIILPASQGLAGPTAIPGSTPGIAIIGDATYTAGGPAVTSAGNTLNSILTDGVVYNAKTYTYTTAEEAYTTIPSFGIGSFDKGNGTVVIAGSGETLYPGGPDLTRSGHTVSAATNGLAIDGKVADVTFGDVSVPLQTVTFESEIMTASEVSSGVFRVYTETLTAGGEAKTVLGQRVTAASSGLVVAATSKSTSTSSTSGASKVATACWVSLASLVAFGLLFSLL